MNHNKSTKRAIAKCIARSLTNDEEWIAKIIVNRLLWSATEIDDNGNDCKYLGNPLWSKQALRLYNENNSKRSRKNFSNLRHEHCVPRNIICSKILSLKNSTRPELYCSKVYRILCKYAHSIVVTKDEDNVLTRLGKRQAYDCNDHDLFQRYRNSGIRVVDVRDRDLKNINCDELIEIT